MSNDIMMATLIVAVVAGASALFLWWFVFKKKPVAKSAKTVPAQPAQSQPPESEDVLEISDEDLARLKVIPDLQTRVDALMEAVGMLTSKLDEAEMEEVEAMPGIYFKHKKNGNGNGNKKPMDPAEKEALLTRLKEGRERAKAKKETEAQQQ